MCESQFIKGHHNIEYIDSNLEKYLIFYGKLLKIFQMLPSHSESD